MESLLEVVDGSRARLDVLAQGSATGDDAARASWGCQSPLVPLTPAPTPPPKHPPVIGTAGGVSDGGVSAVRDEPLTSTEGTQADGWPLGTGHIGAAGIEVTQEEDVLRGSVLCPCPQTSRGSKGFLKSYQIPPGLPSTGRTAPSNGSRATQQLHAGTLPGWHPLQWV